MTPSVTVDREGTVTGNTYDKYGSTNPVVRRLMANFESTLDELFTKADPQSLLDVGCGEAVLTHKWAQRLVHRVDAEDRHGVAPDVAPHRREQARLARLLVGADRDVVDGDRELARLDDRLERVGELRDDGHLHRGLAVVGAKARGRVGHVGLRRLAHDPRAEPLERLLQR